MLHFHGDFHFELAEWVALENTYIYFFLFLFSSYMLVTIEQNFLARLTELNKSLQMKISLDFLKSLVNI